MSKGLFHRSKLTSVSRRFAPAATAVLTATLLFSVATAARAQPAKPPIYRVLYTFTGGEDGALPGVGGSSPLALGREGNLYGTTSFSGNVTSPWCSVNLNCGVVFRVDRFGNESVLHAFTGPPDGYFPEASVIGDDEGNLYGTALGGGAASPSGVVFRLDRAGNETVLHNFANSPDGAGPFGGVIRDGEGNLYGTTWAGGDAPSEWGTVFKLDPAGKETILYNFTGGADGAGPSASLIRDCEGNLYGTTVSGGDGGAPGYNCTNDGVGCGVVFKLDPNGKETVLHSFTGGADGATPFGLTRVPDGTLYGVAAYGGGSFGPSTAGGSNGNGVVFKLEPQGKFSVLHTFTGGADGALPFGTPLRIGADIYGTAYAGGNQTSALCGDYGCGVIYKLDANGNETVLYTFSGYADGDDPSQGLVADAEGNLYGTTEVGGDLDSPVSVCVGYGCGVVFKLALH